MTSASCLAVAVLLLTLLASCGLLTSGQPVPPAILPPFNLNYSLTLLRVPDRVRENIGGITFLDDSTLLIVSRLDYRDCRVKQVPVIRHPVTQSIVRLGVPTRYVKSPYGLTGIGFFPDSDVFFYS